MAPQLDPRRLDIRCGGKGALPRQPPLSHVARRLAMESAQFDHIERAGRREGEDVTFGMIRNRLMRSPRGKVSKTNRLPRIIQGAGPSFAFEGACRCLKPMPAAPIALFTGHGERSRAATFSAGCMMLAAPTAFLTLLRNCWFVVAASFTTAANRIVLFTRAIARKTGLCRAFKFARTLACSTVANMLPRTIAGTAF